MMRQRSLQSAISSRSPVRQLLARDKTAHKIEARRLLYHLLYRRGLSPTTIGRIVGRDHSTVYHQLTNYPPTPLTPEQQKIVDGGRFSYAASKTLGDIPPAHRAAVAAYLRALCIHCPLDISAYLGLVALCRRPHWREHAYCFLRLLGEPAQASRIAIHARQPGLAWVGPVPSFQDLSPEVSAPLKTTNARQRVKKEQINA